MKEGEIKLKWYEKIIKVDIITDKNSMVNQYYDLDKERFFLQCNNRDCEYVQPLIECSNCGETSYMPSKSWGGQLGIFCRGCEKGHAIWTCPSCDKNNEVLDTFKKVQGGMIGIIGTIISLGISLLCLCTIVGGILDAIF